MKLVFSALLGWVLLVANTASAATLYLDPSTATIGRGGTQIFNVRLNTTAEECINAVDAVLYFDEGLEIEDISVGNSIFNIWLPGSPSFDNDSNTVELSAGIPNGYCGRIEGDPTLTNILAEVIVRVDSDYKGEELSKNFYFDPQTLGYLNDGRGTPVALELASADVTINPEYVGGEDDAWLTRVDEDDIAPKSFSITLSRDEKAFKGKYFITFNTNDKQTGIDHYEVYEEPLTDLDLFGWGAATTPWIEAVSPYTLEDQSLNSKIFVKAVDKAGNEYIAMHIPEKEVRGLDENAVILYGLLLLFASMAATSIWYAWHLYHSRRREEETVVFNQYEHLEDE